MERATFFAVLAPLAVLALWAACDTGERPAADGPVTIVFKHGKVVGDPAPVKKIIARFEAANPGVKVVEETLPAATDEQHQFYVINLEGRSAAFDVLSLDVIWGPEFARAGWLRDLTHLMPEKKREEYFAGPIEAVTYREKIYALPWYIDAGVLYYRKDLLEKYSRAPPQTWDELVDIATLITAKEPGVKHGFVWQGKQYEGLVCNALEYFWSAGGEVIEDGKVVIDSAENRRALAFMRDLIHRAGVTPESVNTATEEPARIMFGKGEAVFMRNWPYAWKFYQKDDSPVKGRVGMTTLPHFPGGRPASTLGGWQLGVNAFSRHPREAEKFAVFFTSHESQKLISAAIGFKPTIKRLYADKDLLRAQPHLADLYRIFETARPRPVIPAYVAVSQELQPELSAALTNVKTPEAALASAAEKINAVLRRYE